MKSLLCFRLALQGGIAVQESPADMTDDLASHHCLGLTRRETGSDKRLSGRALSESQVYTARQNTSTTLLKNRQLLPFWLFTALYPSRGMTLIAAPQHYHCTLPYEVKRHLTAYLRSKQ